MAWGEESQSARRSFRDIGLTLRTAEVESPREQAVFAAMLGQIERIAEHRDARIVQSRTHLPGVIWALIVFGGGIVITYTYLYSVQHLQSHMVMIAALATIIATVATVILALDYPFSGDLRIRPDYFERVLAEIEVTASRPSLSPRVATAAAAFPSAWLEI
jgi:hypothetical protein